MTEKYLVPKIYWTDRLLSKTIVRLIPRLVRPNHVTAFRFIATPFVLWLVISEHYVPGMIVFLLVALTDAIDGTMARTRDQITKWGIVFDPIADKLLVGSVLVVLVLQRLSLYLGLAIIAVEAIVALAGLFSFKKNMIFMANWLGKTKMVLQVIGLGLLFVFLLTGINLMHQLAMVVLMASLVFAVANIIAFGLRRAI